VIYYDLGFFVFMGLIANTEWLMNLGDLSMLKYTLHLFRYVSLEIFLKIVY
jgi:hypothetical protein